MYYIKFLAEIHVIKRPFLKDILLKCKKLHYIFCEYHFINYLCLHRNPVILYFPIWIFFKLYFVVLILPLVFNNANVCL